MLPREIELDFADVYDKLLRATDGLDLSRDLVAGARDYHQAKVANDQNEVTKRLTVIASVLLVPTFIVGLYGQNFLDIPELRWGYGYWWSWGWILLTTAAQLLFSLARLDRRATPRAAEAAAAAEPRPAQPCRAASAQPLATIAACRTSSARTARTARSTTTGARA